MFCQCSCVVNLFHVGFQNLPLSFPALFLRVWWVLALLLPSWHSLLFLVCFLFFVRLVFIDSILSSLPYYFFSSYLPPQQREDPAVDGG